MLNDELVHRARVWLGDDPDETTRSELNALVDLVEAGDEAAAADLADRFDGTLEFGTAGLRAAMGAGSNRMNRVVVSRAAAGLAAWLDEHEPADKSVVVGYDARYSSDVFASDTAEIISGSGRPVWLLPRPLPTPVLAFAIRHLGCAAGVMVTASHNPKADNGYKVYLADGSQIATPTDAEISDHIDAIGSVADVPRSAEHQVVSEDVVDAYLATVTGLHNPSTDDASNDRLRMVYTPVHGVGAEMVTRALAAAGFDEPLLVAEQSDPDPEFPTAPFPNPEEPGVLDLALALAEREDADVVFANDPDADRCAVAVPTPDGWRRLTGDEVGALLGDYFLSADRPGTYATTIVSSSLLSTMAQAHGADTALTLTGFKWIGRVPGLAYGYEEALGYCVDPEHVRDKDGVSALVVLAGIAQAAKGAGRTLTDLLDDVALRYGVHLTDQLSIRTEDRAAIDATAQSLLERAPRMLGGLGVVGVDDLSDPPSHGSDLAPTPGVRLRLEHGGRIVVRPSGTEAKLKVYFEVVADIDPDLAETDALGAARIAAAGRLDAMRAELSELLDL